MDGKNRGGKKIAEDRNVLEDNKNRNLENSEIVGACQ